MSQDWYNPCWVSAPKHVNTAAVTTLNEDGHILLIKSPTRGWEIPGGQVEQGEPISLAAVREVEEESGIIVEIVSFCGIFQTVSRSICNFLFLGTPVGGQLTASEESLEVGWFEMPQALDMVTHDNFRSRIEYSLNQDNLPPFYLNMNM